MLQCNKSQAFGEVAGGVSGGHPSRAAKSIILTSDQTSVSVAGLQSSLAAVTAAATEMTSVAASSAMLFSNVMETVVPRSTGETAVLLLISKVSKAMDQMKINVNVNL